MTERVSPLPVACTLIPAALEARRQNLLHVLASRAIECGGIPHGFRLRFLPAAEVLGDIVNAIEAERQCCRFLQFRLTVEPADGPISLELTGPEGTREFLTAMFDR